ncbi:unnamed protein product [Clonostachys byssicola]|uniref:Amine oxidase n=1 Tax=Clonostachys byssicola TaxID=160290 RepID=A0A9N9UAX0_9HYPO|nr:unnamed protein product [Clonostachys byssicola]
MHSFLLQAVAASLLLPLGVDSAALPRRDNSTGTCRKTKVAILGAGVAGVTAAQALANASVSDFVIVDRNDYIGGRVTHTQFGKKADGTPYTVELGANWFQGLGVTNGPENPIWTLGKKYGINNTYSNYSSILSYDEKGPSDYLELMDKWDEAYAVCQTESGNILTENLQDVSVRAGLSLAGWRPQKDMHAEAIEWWGWDFNAAQPPESSSLLFGVAGENATFNHFSDENNFVWDQRGFNAMINGEAKEFLKDGDDRLMLSKKVTTINYSDDSVQVQMEDGSCIEAEHAICTFSLGVLQNEVVKFEPELPQWKMEAIQSFSMSTYTKIFLQFNETFWDENTQFFLYADPHERGRYPVFQSLTGPGFHEGSNIIFVTVTADQAYVVENQTDEETKAEVMEVLRSMFPGVQIPEPTAFFYPRWNHQEWAYGSYSNWPVGVTLERHQNLRANVDRVWFAGEATAPLFFGYLQGAWYEGQEAGQRVASLLGGDIYGENSGPMKNYEVLHGTTFEDEYEDENGWDVDTFEDNNPK